MRISVPPSGKNSTWYAHLLFDQVEAKSFFGPNPKPDLRVRVIGNAVDGIRIKIDSVGSHRVNFSTGSPYIQLKCDDFWFIPQGKAQHGVPTEISNGTLTISHVPESLVSIYGRKLLADRRRDLAMAMQKSLVDEPKYRQNLDVPAAARSVSAARTDLAFFRAAAQKAIEELYEAAEVERAAGRDVTINISATGKVSVRIVTEVEI